MKRGASILFTEHGGFMFQFTKMMETFGQGKRSCALSMQSFRIQCLMAAHIVASMLYAQSFFMTMWLQQVLEKMGAQFFIKTDVIWSCNFYSKLMAWKRLAWGGLFYSFSSFIPFARLSYFYSFKILPTLAYFWSFFFIPCIFHLFVSFNSASIKPNTGGFHCSLCFSFILFARRCHVYDYIIPGTTSFVFYPFYFFLSFSNSIAMSPSNINCSIMTSFIVRFEAAAFKFKFKSLEISVMKFFAVSWDLQL